MISNKSPDAQVLFRLYQMAYKDGARFMADSDAPDDSESVAERQESEFIAALKRLYDE